MSTEWESLNERQCRHLQPQYECDQAKAATGQALDSPWAMASILQRIREAGCI